MDKELVMFLLQGVWGLFLLVFTFALNRLIRDLDTNTKQTKAISERLTELNVTLVTNFSTKPDERYMRDRIHELANHVAAIEAREELRERLKQNG